jgi:hypothetical protein
MIHARIQQHNFPRDNTFPQRNISSNSNDGLIYRKTNQGVSYVDLNTRKTHRVRIVCIIFTHFPCSRVIVFMLIVSPIRCAMRRSGANAGQWRWSRSIERCRYSSGITYKQNIHANKAYTWIPACMHTCIHAYMPCISAPSSTPARLSPAKCILSSNVPCRNRRTNRLLFYRLMRWGSRLPSRTRLTLLWVQQSKWRRR